MCDMTYIVLKAPLNSNQPTQSGEFLTRCLMVQFRVVWRCLYFVTAWSGGRNRQWNNDRVCCW